jgi:AAA domain
VAPPERAGDAPKVHFAPALILRRRSPRSLIEFYSSVVEQLRDETTLVPPAVHDIIEILEEQAAGDGALAALEPRGGEELPAEEPPAPPPRPADREVYFPLPSNDEQWRIVERLERHRGVVVQRPPGTGKSHTIANLISHLAAVGKRVLVTSHTGRALEVLKGKLPPDVAKLCVSVVGDGGPGDRGCRPRRPRPTRTGAPGWSTRATPSTACWSWTRCAGPPTARRRPSRGWSRRCGRTRPGSPSSRTACARWRPPAT